MEVLKVIIKIEIVVGKRREEIRHSVGIMEMKKLVFSSLKLSGNIHECRANSQLLTNVIKQGGEQLVYLISTK